jgi:hypothetical protein
MAAMKQQYGSKGTEEGQLKARAAKRLVNSRLHGGNIFKWLFLAHGCDRRGKATGESGGGLRHRDPFRKRKFDYY